MNEYLVGDTVKITWVSSGASPTDLHYSVYAGDETLVASETLSSSGNGHYYGFYTIPNSGSQYYTVQTKGTIGGKPYKRRMNIRGVLEESD